MTELEFQTSFSAIVAMKTNVEQIVVNLSIELAKANITIAQYKEQLAEYQAASLAEPAQS